MEIMNLVVTGTVGAGKTTFIRSVSEIEVVDTDRKATDEVSEMKQNTTVAMDFGTLPFGDEMALHIYGTPGQIRFDFMWEILIERAHAYVLLIAAHRPSEFHHARRIMNFMNRRAQIPMIIGITHSDCEGAWSSEDIALALGYQDIAQQPPIVLVNAADGESVAMSLIALVEHYMHTTAAAAAIAG
ncbi:ATP/GTP-binding protein [Chamaesiphon sp. OTE_8_metabat_110]|uniref:GTP-binding protein n=1 Tax=Chamaesiphon sp. OTE_8_metabat_110 TaxID=2964696 RepID=UPI00286A2553|nr:ATP/GTP-binding protein [Chamaesiphon sp. OTE_8_metabat_110]